MLRSKTRTQGRKYPRRAYWIQQRDKVFDRAGDKCEVSGESLGFWSSELAKDGPFGKEYLPWVWRRAVDHIIPERAARKMFPGCDPHCDGNLVCVSSSIHARKTPMERRIYSGDYIGYVGELRRIGFTQDMIDKALKALNESVKKK